MVKYLLICSVLSSAITAYAQDQGVQKADTSAIGLYILPEVEVNGVRFSRSFLNSALSFSLLKEDRINRGEFTLSLGEALKTIPGLYVNSRNNQSQGDRITVRGIGSRAQFGVRGLKIILDGVPLTMPDGQSQLNNIDLSTIKSIDIIRGPSSALYGNASGGTILLSSRHSADSDFSFQPSLTFGSFSTRKLNFGAAGNLRDFRYNIVGSAVDFDGYRDHADGEYHTINGIGSYPVGENVLLKSVVSYYSAPYLFNPGSVNKSHSLEMPEESRSFLINQGAGKKVEQFQAGLTFQYDKNNKHTVESTLYIVERALDNPIPGRIIDLNRSAAGFRSLYRINNIWGLENTNFVTGIDIEFQDDERQEFENEGIDPANMGRIDRENILEFVRRGDQLIDQDESVLSVGRFSEINFKIKDKWGVNAGIRFDYYKFKANDHFLQDSTDDSGNIEMNSFNPMIGTFINLKDNLTLYGNISGGFQTPTTNELSNQPDREGGFNASLKPENINSFEFGLKGISLEKNMIFDLTFFNMKIDDMLLPFQIEESESEEVFYRNAGKTKNTGFELSVDWRPQADLAIHASYAKMNFEFDDYSLEVMQGVTQQLSGNKVPGIPPHRVNIEASYLIYRDMYVESNFEWVDEYFANDLNGPLDQVDDVGENNFINDAYGVLDLRIGMKKTITNLEFNLFAGVNNLFDEQYGASIVPNAVGRRFFEPAPGINGFAGVSFQFLYGK